MSRLRWPACLLALCVPALPVVPAQAGDRQVELQVSLVLVEACTVHAPSAPDAAPRVECSSDLPYRLEERPAPPEAEADTARIPGPNGLTVLF